MYLCRQKYKRFKNVIMAEIQKLEVTNCDFKLGRDAEKTLRLYPQRHRNA